MYDYITIIIIIKKQMETTFWIGFYFIFGWWKNERENKKTKVKEDIEE